MEDQAEQTEALKKAYAEIILNTAKEAAARAMVSECKALRFHHDLRNTKDEALRMTLRLKQMIDAKTSEAELTSLSQQNRIEELDAQLNEAEGVIVNLRAELKKSHERLEEVKNSHMLQSNGLPENKHIHHFENTDPDNKLNVTEQFRSSSQSRRSCNPAKETITSGPQSDNFFIGKPSSASIIIGSKEPEFSRNGYTHRIRAIERNLVDGKNISADKPAEEICTIKELIINVDEKSTGKCDPSIDAENTYMNTDTKSINESEALSTKSSIAKDQTVKTQRLPKSSVRYARSKPKLSRFSPGQSIKPTTDHEKVNLNENSLEKDENSTENKEKSSCTLRRSVRKRKVRCWDDISSLFKSRAAFDSKKYSGNDGMKFDEHQYKSKSVAEINEGITPMSSSADASEETYDDDSPRPFHVNAVEDTKLQKQNESVVEKHKVCANESSGVSTCNSITETYKVLGTESIPAEHAGEAACDTVKNSRLKYTFSRKRKKGLSSKSDNCSSLEKSFSLPKLGEKPSLTPENEKPNMIEDQSRDSENMVEVACQLISLSGECGR